MRQVIPFLIVLLYTTVAQACPSCGKAVEVQPGAGDGGGGAAAGIVDRFNTSTYLLLGTVILAMGFLAWNLLRSSKPTAAKQDAIGESKTA